MATAEEKRARDAAVSAQERTGGDMALGHNRPGAPHARLGIMPLIKRTTTNKTIAPTTALTTSGTKPVPM